jgi:hypothetical protein
MVVYDPRGQTWDSWCALMNELFAAQQLGMLPEDRWTEWADAFSGNGYFSRSGAPDSRGFETWQDWAFRLLGIIDIDYLTGPNMATSGASFTFPYGAFSSYVTQTTTANTATKLTLSQTDFANAVSLSSSDIIVDYAGIYNLQFSVQVSSLENALTDTSIWLRQNGVDIVGSTGLIGMSARKGPSDPSHDIKGWNYFLSMNAGDNVQIWWSTTSANVSIKYYPVSASPTRPSTASVVATLSFVSAI